MDRKLAILLQRNKANLSVQVYGTLFTTLNLDIITMRYCTMIGKNRALSNLQTIYIAKITWKTHYENNWKLIASLDAVGCEIDCNAYGTSSDNV